MEKNLCNLKSYKCPGDDVNDIKSLFIFYYKMQYLVTKLIGWCKL